MDGVNDILYSGSADHTIKVWHLSHIHPTWSRVTCKMTLLGHTDTVRCLQVNESILISGSYDNTLKIWDLKSGKCTNTLRYINKRLSFLLIFNLLNKILNN